MQRSGSLAADVYGEGDTSSPLVLLHGLTFDRTMWRPALEELAAREPQQRAVAFDLPGHGESNTQESCDIDSVVATVHRAIDAAGIESPVVVGHSIGAVIATAYAAQHPARGVVNVDQPLFIAPFAELLQSIEAQLRGPNFAEVWQMFAASFHVELLSPAAQEVVRTTSSPRQDLVLAYWKEVIERPVASLTAMVEARLAQLSEQHLPYVIVAGAALDPTYETWLQKMLPEAQVVVWPNSGHFPHLAKPAALRKSLPTRQPGNNHATHEARQSYRSALFAEVQNAPTERCPADASPSAERHFRVRGGDRRGNLSRWTPSTQQSRHRSARV
jgi:pimeloyl-ACP methyl ester carboxylesterase